MKKKGITLAFVLLISALSFGVLSSCDKNTKCYIDVHVVTRSGNKPVPQAKVVIDSEGGSINRSGYTDESGLFSTAFYAPAVMTVTATTEEREGSSSIRLKEGELVEVTIAL